MKHTKCSLSLALLGLLALMGVAPAASAAAAAYRVYSGDFNGDGLTDYYVKPLPKIVPIMLDDLSIPIPVKQKIGPFVLQKVSAGSSSYTVVFNLSAGQLTTLNGWTTESHNAIRGDFNGDSKEDLLLQSIQTGGPSIIVRGAGSNTVAPVFDRTIVSSTYGFDISANAGVSVQVSDVDGDHWDDLIFHRTSQPDFVVVSHISRPPPDFPLVGTDPSADTLTGNVYNGALRGEYSVDSNGGFSYSIPLIVPPGVNGMQPKLGLKYSSNRGNGSLGVGWSLSGLSVIDRCPANKLRDGYVSGIDTGESYKFCLDGQRLVEVATGQYRLESETFVHVKRMGGTAAVPDYWVVEQSNGSVDTYGGTVNSELEDRNGQTIQWYVQKEADVAGNYLTYTYLKAGSEHRIDHINYTMNDAAPVSQPLNQQVTFTYEARPDVSSSYLAGVEHAMPNRLSRIQMSAQGSVVRQYLLDYQAIDGTTYADPVKTSRLKQITQCASSTSDCLTPINLAWTDMGSDSIRMNESPIGSDYIVNPGTSRTLRDLSLPYYQLVDLDGDGYLDWIDGPTPELQTADGTSLVQFNDVSVHYGTEAVTDSTITTDYLNRLRNQPAVLVTTTNVLTHTYHIHNSGGGGSSDSDDIVVTTVHVATIDVNGDGRLDIVVTDDYNQRGLMVYLNQGRTFSYSAAYSLPQSAISYQGSVTCPTQINTTVSGYFPARIMYRDFNGDGKVDLLMYFRDKSCGVPISNTVSVALNQPGGGFGTFQPWLTAPVTFRGDYVLSQTPQLGDFNGDGLPDLLGVNGQVAINTGASFVFRSEWPALPQSTTYENLYTLGDFNGDGLTDLLVLNPFAQTNGDVIKLSTGAGFADAYTGASCQIGSASVSASAITADMNGDGRDDLIYYAGDLSSNIPGSMKICFATHVVSGAVDSFSPVEMTSSATPNLKSLLAGANYWRGINNEYVQGRDTVAPPADYNSDGIPDWVTTSRLHKHQIVSVDEGGTRQIAVNYLPLAAHGLHTSGSATTAQPMISYSNDSVALGTGGEVAKQSIGYYSIAQDPYAGLQAVNTLTVSDGIGGTMAKAFHYQGGKRQVGGWGNLGFEQVTETEQVSSSEVRRTETDYFQVATSTYPFSGRPKERRVYATDASRSTLQLLSRERFNWRIRLYSDDIDGAPSPHYFPYLAESSKESWDLNGAGISNALVLNHGSYSPNCTPIGTPSLAEITTDADYHADGVLLYGQTTTCDALASSAAVQFSSTTNSSISQQGTAFGLIGRQVQTAGVGSSLSALTLAARTTAFTYVSGHGQLSTKTIEPDAGADLLHTTTYTYNAYGSISNAAESWQNSSNNGLSFTSRSTGVTETFTSGVRQIIRINALNQSETVTFNAAFGLPFQTTDVNGHTSSTYYDTQGRVSYVLLPDGRRSDFAYRRCTSCFSGNSSAVSYVQQKITGAATVRKYLDGLDRDVGDMRHSLDGAEVYTLKTYNHDGLVASTRDPYKASDSPIATTLFSYDILKRAKTTTYADSTTQLVTYNGLSRTLTNRLTQTQTRVANAAGWVMSNTDNAGTPVVFTYWPFGELRTTTINGNSATLAQIQYDTLGRKTQLNDPNTGTINYTYNALGLLASQTDAKNQVTRFSYDVLGRQLQRIDAATSSSARTQSWTFDNQTNGVGLPSGVSGTSTDGTPFSETYTYTALSQLDTTTTLINSRSFQMSLHYDNFSRVVGKTYPSGYSTGQYYNNQGLLYKVASMDDGTALWTANAQDARGNVTQFTLGNGVVTNKTFDWASGYINTIQASKGSLTIQDHDYDFDALGNLKQRRSGSLVQNFCYDNMNRLVAARFNGCTSSDTDFTYDALGNKYNAGASFVYGQSAGPHAVTSVNGKSYHYDADGNLTGIFNGSTQERTIDYSAFNTPTRISDTNGHWSEVVYGPQQSRVKRTDNTGRTSMYAALDSYEETTFNGTTERVHYLGDFAIYVEQSGASNSSYYRYLHRDHNGSIVAKSDEQATSSSNIEWLANGPWGERRHLTWDGAAEGINYQPTTTARGFTNHEHLDGLGLIHMNGRVYDEVTGRFLTPDPMVQAPYNTQSYNRYAYVFNNPLSFTDPSGYEATKNDPCWDFIGRCEFVGNDAFTLTIKIHKDGSRQLTLRNNVTKEVKDSGRFTLPHTASQRNPFIGYDAGPGERTAAATWALMHDPDISEETKKNIAKVSAIVATAGSVAIASRTLAIVLGFSSDTLAIQDGLPAGGKLGNSEIRELIETETGAAREQLLNTFRARALEQAGFSAKGVPVILDENLAGRGVAEALRAQGFNVRSSTEIFGSGAKDPTIRAFAEALGARVLTADRGRELGQGFGRLAIGIPGQVGQDLKSISRLLSEALK